MEKLFKWEQFVFESKQNKIELILDKSTDLEGMPNVGDIVIGAGVTTCIIFKVLSLTKTQFKVLDLQKNIERTVRWSKTHKSWKTGNKYDIILIKKTIDEQELKSIIES